MMSHNTNTHTHLTLALDLACAVGHDVGRAELPSCSRFQTARPIVEHQRFRHRTKLHGARWCGRVGRVSLSLSLLGARVVLM